MEAVAPRQRAVREERKDLALRAAIDGVSAAFASLGRVFLCVDSRFHVLHASSLLDRLIGTGAAAAARGRPVAELLGAELFGPSGTLASCFSRAIGARVGVRC